MYAAHAGSEIHNSKNLTKERQEKRKIWNMGFGCSSDRSQTAQNMFLNKQIYLWMTHSEPDFISIDVFLILLSQVCQFVPQWGIKPCYIQLTTNYLVIPWYWKLFCKDLDFRSLYWLQSVVLYSPAQWRETKAVETQSDETIDQRFAFCFNQSGTGNTFLL